MTKKDFELIGKTLVETLVKRKYPSMYFSDFITDFGLGLARDKKFDCAKFQLNCYNYTGKLREVRQF